MTSFWFALGDDAAERLRGLRPQLPRRVRPRARRRARRELHRRTGPTRSCGRSSTMAELGYDEVQLVPTTTDLAELDRLAEVVERFRQG